MKTKKVKICFGKYGTKESKDCRDDCIKCEDTKKEGLSDIIFCKKKKGFPCDILCDDVDDCKDCYWNWWEKNKLKKCSLNDNIKKFMKERKLVHKKDGKQY